MGDTVVVASWTLVSRITGFVRVTVTAAVLGPTFLGNTYQATNLLPNIIYYGLLAGSLVSSLLVPALVGHIDAGDRRACERVAGSALGLALVAAVVVIPIALLVAPLLLEVGTLGSPAAAVAAQQAHLARWFLLMLLPQVVLYAVVACSLAVMNAHRRFALGAAAPAVENLGCIAVLGAVAVLFPPTETLEIPTAELLLLGLGTTAAVALHAAVQWWGAWRTGATLRPRRGWRDAEVRALVRRALPALAQAALDALQLVCVLVVVNRIAGGVVAFQLALNFFFLPIALGATPVALSLSPRLSRLHQRGERALFRDTAVRGLRFGLFVSAPAAVVLVVLAPVLASAASFGRMLTDGGALLVAAGLVALAPGVVGETAFLIGTYSCYARDDTRSPLRAMGVKAGVCLLVLGGAVSTDGAGVVALAAVAVSAAAVLAAVWCVRALLRGLPRTGEPLLVPALRTAAAAVVMAVPLGLAAWVMSGGALFSGPGGRFIALAGAVVACLVGGAVYLLAQWLLRAPEATWLLGALRGRRVGPLDLDGEPA
ncbi:murein biosynthesis integral membrane protein MurJ [Actinomycetospora lutea]|uniref:murein biosynthesis integral membrane protein MurJ n=1 Tax=Actinomycetospora lutea TaxID=663604 RepID=UPI0023670BAB|nr:lipid II flippase MurJ [Actinomycetospora lutea]